ncbi:MAG: hypothetical protein CK544_00560, partial [Planctomycetaceae bacterium]
MYGAAITLVAACFMAAVAPTQSSKPLDPTQSAPPQQQPAEPPSARAASELALKSLAAHPTWIRRLMATMRLERADESGVRERLNALALDSDPRV